MALLMEGGAVIGAAARVSRVAFDKTGILSHGKPAIIEHRDAGICVLESIREALLHKSREGFISSIQYGSWTA